MPVLGVAGYLLIILLIVAGPLGSSMQARLARYALAGGTAFGFLFSVYLDYLQGYVIHAYCAWCVTSGVIMMILFALAIYDVFRPEPEVDAPARRARMHRFLAITMAGVLIGVPAFYGLARHGETPPAPKTSTVSSLANLVRADSHLTGNLNAAVTVVEFGDLECPVCGLQEKVMRQIRTKYAKQVRFVFRQFPLVRIHPFAWRAAEASECAAEQGKFWEAVDEIYSRQTDLSEKGLQRVAADIGLDQAKFNQCMDSGAAAGRVREDLADGEALGVDATPTFFIGHREIVGAMDVKEFSRMIDQALAAHAVELSSPSPKPQSPAPSASSSPNRAKRSPQRETAPGKAAPAKGSAGTGQSAFGSFGSVPSLGQPPVPPSGPGCSEAEAAEQQPTLIDTAQLRQLLAGGSKPVFVDVRPPQEYAQGRIPGAVNIPAMRMAKLWSTLPKDRVIVLYESGQSSSDVCAFSRAAGRTLLEHGYPFSQVKVYQDGLAGWKKSGLALAP